MWYLFNSQSMTVYPMVEMKLAWTYLNATESPMMRQFGKRLFDANGGPGLQTRDAFKSCILACNPGAFEGIVVFNSIDSYAAFGMLGATSGIVELNAMKCNSLRLDAKLLLVRFRILAWLKSKQKVMVRHAATDWHQRITGWGITGWGRIGVLPWADQWFL